MGSLEQLQVAKRLDHHPGMTDVVAPQGRTPAVVEQRAFCSLPGEPHVQEGSPRAFSRTEMQMCSVHIALRFSPLLGQREQSTKLGENGRLFSSIPNLRQVLWGMTKSQIFGGACPNPIIECSYLHTRGWGNMHLFCLITHKDGRLGGGGSLPKLNPAVLELSAVSLFSLCLAVNSNIWL